MSLLLGLEQFLDGDPERERDIVCEFPDMASSEEINSDPIEDITMDDLSNVEPVLRPPPNRLMSLLSGDQTGKKRRYTKKPKKTPEEPVLKDLAEPMADIQLLSFSDPVEIPDTSFDASEFERNAEKTREIEALEKKMFSSGKTVSLKDFLKKSAPAPVINKHTDTDKSAISPEIIAIDDEIESVPEPIIIEDYDALFPASKSVNARNLFDSFGPKRMKKPNGEWSLKVRLKISPEKLAAIKKTESSKTLGNNRAGGSMLAALMKKKPSLKVSLKVPNEVLETANKKADPLHTQSSGSRGAKSANGVFAMMMKTASQNAFPKLTAIQKLKGLQPPPVSRNCMHVVPENDNNPAVPVPFRRRINNTTISYQGSMVDLVPDTPDSSEKPHLEIPRLRYDLDYTLEELIRVNAPLAYTSTPHKTIFTKFIQGNMDETKHLNWPQRFQPNNIESLLIEEESRAFLKRWMSNAFAVLETQSTKTPRNVKLKELQRKQRKREAQDFIVDDDEDEEESTDEDVFVPILVIQGDSGSCKSASVYAAMAAMDGYVHEINTGQARARKDVYSSLREFCTTQIIHQNHDEKKFQKGLVLFEDCDILFEQDKTFWTTVQEVINFSRRPIVVTVKDMDVIPRNILELAEEQNSILNLKIAPKIEAKQYLWLCAFSEHLSLSSEVLEGILRECQTNTSLDLRKALMSCQWFCYIVPPTSGVCEILYDTPQLTAAKPEPELAAMIEKLDTISVADVLEANTHSCILHEVQPNELLDIYVIDDSLHLKQKTLPHELNTGGCIKELYEQEPESKLDETWTFNDIRTRVLDFISSRAKKMPKFLQELYGMRVQTRSRSSEAFVEERPDTQGLKDTSACYNMSRSAFVQELAPTARYWASFQNGILALDKETKKDANKPGLVEFIGWRKFYDGVEEVLETGPYRNEN